MTRVSPPDAVEIARRLIRFDTTNPPGNERACIEYIRDLLDAAGVETTLRSRDQNRPNLIARVRGRGVQPPLLLHGHVDVVPVPDPERWQHDPFGGEIVDGELWGRGAVDMKGGLAMMLAALLRVAAADAPPPGDVVLAALSDEEGGGAFGARFLVEQHRELFDGIRYAVGEFGAVARPVNGRNVYLVPVAEKQWCTLRLSLHEPGGHGALPTRGRALAKLARLLAELDRTRLPHHLPGVSANMIDAYADALPAEQAESIRGLKDPELSGDIFDSARGGLALFEAAVHNTATPTVVRAGDRVDAVPDAAEVLLDGRVLPDQTPVALAAELGALCGEEVAIEVTHFDEPPTNRVDTGLLDSLTSALAAVDPGATVVPTLNPGVTDGRFFSRLGIQHHGFLPMQLPHPGAVIQTMHGADEHIPVSALQFGANVFEELLLGF